MSFHITATCVQQLWMQFYRECSPLNGQLNGHCDRFHSSRTFRPRQGRCSRIVVVVVEAMKLFCVPKTWNRRVLGKPSAFAKRAGGFKRRNIGSDRAAARTAFRRSDAVVLSRRSAPTKPTCASMANESYKPVESDELAVAAGDLLYGVYCYNNDWLYVVNEQGDEGFVPSRVCEFAYRRSVVRNDANGTAATMEVNQPRVSKSRTASPAGLENVNRFLKTLSICSELDSFTRPQSESPHSSGWNEPTSSVCSIGASSDDSFRNLGQLLPVAAGSGDKRKLFLQAYNTVWNDANLALCQTNC
ncbi:putative SH3 domain protein [Trichinella spiralis]|uniref:putative SH3 domain protein n=1 Tax=Trichinella spiralis TaxID=6334 RepID=UPI0001EFD078|nr:putative SH3 domain protein [Trichinella spiralis]